MHLSPPAVVHSKVVAPFLFLYRLMYFTFSRKFYVCLCFFYPLLCVHFSFVIILKRKRKLVALLLLSYRCVITKMFCIFSSWCHELVFCMWLWYFLIILTHFFMFPLSDDYQSNAVDAFKSTSRHLDDLLNFDNPKFQQVVSQIYPTEFQLNEVIL